MRIKPEAALETVASQKIFEDPNFSVDDLYLSLSVFTDLSEQIWAQAKSKGTPADVRAFVNSVSRPFSSFNRLGSFINWGNSGAVKLAEQGLFYRESVSVSHFENTAVEISDLSEETLLSQDFMREHLGQGNRFLNSQVTENVPLHKTLSYFNARSVKQEESDVIDVIASQNSEYVLVGSSNGTFTVVSSNLTIPETREFSMFDLEKKRKLKKI